MPAYSNDQFNQSIVNIQNQCNKLKDVKVNFKSLGEGKEIGKEISTSLNKFLKDRENSLVGSGVIDTNIKIMKLSSQNDPESSDTDQTQEVAY